MPSTYKAPDGTSVGHIHLKVTDLERALEFYRDLLGFELTTMYGDQAAFLSAGGYHHHIGLNTWHSKGGPPAPRNSAGLFHTAFLYPTRKDLARIVKRLIEIGYPISGASDHGVSEAIYLQDPDGNGVELYRDRPREEWEYTVDGSVKMVTEPLDLEGLLQELEDKK
jgi:catechol 2,3-dioxygenase